MKTYQAYGFFCCLSLAIMIASAFKKPEHTIRYLALGDSYTIGESVNTNENWPNQLCNIIKKSGYTIELKSIAQTGWRTDNLIEATKIELTSGEKFDIVSLLVGVNNEFQGKSVKSFTEEFERSLKLAISKSKNGDKGVFVLSIPDYGFTPYGSGNQEKISQRIDLYNAVCIECCKKMDVDYYDITAISRLGITQKNLVASDGLHPSAAQYQLWVNKIKPHILNKINNLDN